MPWKILIADDSRLIRKLIRNALTAAGMEIAGEAATGEEAIKMYSRLRPDLITIDISMPDMDGIDAARGILSRDPRAKVLMVTSLKQKLLEEDLLKIGARAMIAKPFDAPDLLKAVHIALQNPVEAPKGPPPAKKMA
jgi:two-component system chemotaxis response regulator CheY